MFNILSFLQGGWPIFEKRGIEKSRGTIYKKEGQGPLGNYVIWHKGYLKHVLPVYMSVR